ncbi:MAG TPA: Ldh family oxidoreductase, partial [Burkholderiales bacterium]|nr:Ldh family oxidoreductase [Burkholderiales bacterium]
NKQLPIPLGWAINSAGEPTTDPQEAIDGIILPMAEHKGYAIAAMVDMLSGVLSGSGFLSAVHSPYKTAEKSNCGHLMIAMDIAKFQPLEQFHARMATFTSEIKSVPLAQGFDEVFYPGVIENNNHAKFSRDGLQLPDDTIADLKRIAKETGLEAKLPL